MASFEICENGENGMAKVRTNANIYDKILRRDLPRLYITSTAGRFQSETRGVLVY